VRGAVSCLGGPPTGLLVLFLLAELAGTGFAGPVVGMLVITGEVAGAGVWAPALYLGRGDGRWELSMGSSNGTPWVFNAWPRTASIERYIDRISLAVNVGPMVSRGTRSLTPWRDPVHQC
jgi:hypothetical protein